MKITCGIDIIEVKRIKESLKKDRFKNKVYTEKEIAYCESKKNKYEHFAVRFAAKEAVFKAISEMLESKAEISWQDIEILNKDNGKPYINLKNLEKYNIEIIDISLSHIKDSAIANCIIQFK